MTEKHIMAQRSTMSSLEFDANKSVVCRLANLPLVSSTCHLLSLVYCNTKDNHPYLKTVCEVAESGVKTLITVALTRTSPVLDMLKPQIGAANVLACKGLDKIEQTWPILHQPPEQIEYTRRNVGDANSKLHSVQGKLSSWVEWKRGGHDGGDGEEQHMESRTLAVARSLTHQLQTTCLSLAPSLQGLPQNIQHQALSVALSASEIYSSFSGASAFRDLSDGALASSRAQLARMKESLDSVMDYLVNNTPLNWLVPDFTITDLASEPDGAFQVEESQVSYIISYIPRPLYVACVPL
ncbi:hypothetical protein AAFF_G00199450 [Aldrovandia affinis]|uniref:Perilipin n=1 Tax=Aldrovandia affinis TaxID=143900 RepID=A0AAD7RIA0_9TELE|nr:hypothetical protein AAFF_G00199450 [Aldrovandia affinis]